MKLSELISKYGDEKVKFQNLDNSIIEIKYDRKKGTKITFGTDAPIHTTDGTNGTKELGLVIWMDRKIVEELLKCHQEIKQ